MFNQSYFDKILCSFDGNLEKCRDNAPLPFQYNYAKFMSTLPAERTNSLL